MRLLQGSWGEILTLSLIYRSQESISKQSSKSMEDENKSRSNSSNQVANVSSQSQKSSQVSLLKFLLRSNVAHNNQ